MLFFSCCCLVLPLLLLGRFLGSPSLCRHHLDVSSVIVKTIGEAKMEPASCIGIGADREQRTFHVPR